MTTPAEIVSELKEFLKSIEAFPNDDTFRCELDRAGVNAILEAIRAAENDALARFALQPIETAPKKGPITLYASNAAGDGHYVVGIWYFGDWAMAEPDLGERLRFTPTHWAHLPKQPKS